MEKQEEKKEVYFVTCKNCKKEKSPFVFEKQTEAGIFHLGTEYVCQECGYVHRTAVHRVEITQTPDKFNLAFAFFNRHPVRLVIADLFGNGKRDLNVVINKLCHEDGSGESFIFEFYYHAGDDQPSIILEGYMNLRSGTGVIMDSKEKRSTSIW